MRWRMLITVGIVATLIAVTAGSGAVAGQQAGVQIHDATVSTPSIVQGETFSVSVEFTNVHPTEVSHNVTIQANGAQVERMLLVTSPGERDTQSTTVFETDTLEPGTYTITVEDTEAGQLTVTEPETISEEPDSEDRLVNGYFGPAGKLIGAPILGLGAIFFLGSFGIEIVRGYKEYIGEGAEKGMKPAIVSLLIGSAGMLTGGFLVGGTIGLTLAIAGFAFLLVFGVLAGGYYGVDRLYHEL